MNFRNALLLINILILSQICIGQNIPVLNTNNSQFPIIEEGRISGEVLYEGGGFKITINGPTEELIQGNSYTYTIVVENGDYWETESGKGIPDELIGNGRSQILFYYNQDNVIINSVDISIDGSTTAQVYVEGAISLANLGISVSLKEIITGLVEDLAQQAIIEGGLTLASDYIETETYNDLAINNNIGQLRYVLGQGQNLFNYAFAKRIELKMNLEYINPGPVLLSIIPDIRGTFTAVPDSWITSTIYGVLYEYRRQINITNNVAPPPEPDRCTVSIDKGIGNQNTLFKFTSTFYNHNGDHPTSAELVILGDSNAPYTLTKESGSQNTYSAVTNLPVGNQQYYARFVNNENKLVQSETKTVKVVNSEDMTINVIMHCDEEGENLELEYKINDETKYTKIDLLPDDIYTVSIEPNSGIEFIASRYDNYNFIKYKFTEPNGIEHEAVGNLLNINFNEFSNGIFDLDMYYEYSPQNYLLQGTITDVEGNPYTQNVSLNLQSNQQSESLSISNGNFSFNDIYGGIPVTITPELSSNGEILYPEAFYVGNLIQHYTEINFVVESGDVGLPVIEFLETPNEEVTSGQVEFVWNSYDDVTESNQIQYSYFLSGYSTSWSNFANDTQVSFTLENGNYTFSIKAQDLNGNLSQISYQFVVNADPFVQVVEQEYGGSLGTRIRLNRQGDESGLSVFLLPKHSVNINSNLVPVRLYRLKEKNACGCLSEVSNSLGLTSVFFDRGNCFELIIPDTFTSDNELEYVIEWGYRANYGWRDEISLEEGFLDLEPNSSYRSYIPDEVLDENLNLWRVAVRDRDYNRGKDAWAYIDMVNSEGIQIKAKEIAFEKGYYYTNDDYLHHDFEDAEIYDFEDCKVVVLEEEVNEEQGGVKIHDIEYRYQLIQVNNHGDILNSAIGEFYPDVSMQLAKEKVDDAVWIFYKQNSDNLFYEVIHKTGEQIKDFTLLFDTPEDHSSKIEEVYSSLSGKAYVIIHHNWRTDLSERRSELILKILNADGGGTVHIVNLGLPLESDLVDFDDEYELMESTIDNQGRLWMLINHEYSSNPDKHFLVVVDNNGNLVTNPIETSIDDLGVCDKEGRLWAEDGDLTVIFDEDLTYQSYLGGYAPPKKAGNFLVNYSDDWYEVFDNESPYQFDINWNGLGNIDTCQFINTNTGLNISEPNVLVNSKLAFEYENIIDSVLSFSLKDYIFNGLNTLSVEQSSPVGGSMFISFPVERNTPPFISNRLSDIVLNEDFNEYLITDNLTQIFFDENPLEISVYTSKSIIEYVIEQDDLVIYSIDNAFGEGEIYIYANDGQFIEKDTINFSILPVNDVPIIEAQSLSIDENAENHSFISSIQAYDVDNDNIAFSIKSGNVNNTFNLEAFSGDLYVNDSTELDFEKNQFIDLIIQVQDDGVGFLKDEATIRININDVYENPTSFNELKDNNQIKLYPIPIEDFLHIKVPDFNNSLTNVVIIDLNGRALMNINITSKIKTISCSELPSGYYTLKITGKNYTKAFKILKK